MKTLMKPARDQLINAKKNTIGNEERVENLKIRVSELKIYEMQTKHVYLLEILTIKEELKTAKRGLNRITRAIMRLKVYQGPRSADSDSRFACIEKYLHSYGKDPVIVLWYGSTDKTTIEILKIGKIKNDLNITTRYCSYDDTYILILQDMSQALSRNIQ